MRFQTSFVSRFSFLVFRLCRLSLLLSLLPFIARAESLDDWVAGFETPEIQQKILNGIFSGQVGSVSAARLDKNGRSYLFPKNSSWVRLGGEKVWVSSTSSQGEPYLIVSVMLYRYPDKGPVNATSYLFRDIVRRPRAISGGYASYEQVREIRLPKLKKSFVLLVDGSDMEQGKYGQWSAFLLEIPAAGDQPRTVWISPTSARNFQLGFDDLDGRTEALIFRSAGRGTEGYHYSAYRWNGSRFEPDSSVFESKLKTLPESAWRYGSPTR